MDLTLVTCAELPEPDPDAAPLAEALRTLGVSFREVPWSASDVDWSLTPLTVIRSPWDYPLHVDAFVAWAERVSGLTRLCNSAEIVRWNSHKSYLLELADRGVPIVPTKLLRKGDQSTLAAIQAERGWSECVVKPAVSCGSYKTLRVGPQNLDAGRDHLAALLGDGDVLVQQYLTSVEGYGERALVWIDGLPTHAVRKSPRFQGQDESVSEAVPISLAESALAEQALDALDHKLLYARVDMAPGSDGAPVVMELELIEPSLFFAQCPDALRRFVGAIHTHMSYRPA
jgi:hypothetical protein